MLDVRYHIAWLCVVFLMLGIGMLMGASFYGPAQVQRQAKYLSDLREQANTAVQESRAAEDQTAKLDQAIEVLRPSLVRGVLKGKRVVLIQTGDYADATEAATEALSDAGASVAGTVVLAARWDTLSPERRTAMLKTLVTALTAPPRPNAPGTWVALEDQGLVAVAGDLSQPCLLFVLVGGGQDGSGDPVDTALAQQLSAVPNVSVAGCEPFEAAVSFVPLYQKAGIATVDCIDRPVGQLALPFALRGGTDAADYGLKPTARRTVPLSLQSGGRA